jgi:GDPmannose 4,6-dehydratase
MKTAIVTGITGQDGAYLSALLLSKGYKVYGAYRRTSSVNFWRLDELNLRDHERLELVEHDLTDLASSVRLLERCKPDEIYNLAAQSFVGVSFDQPITTGHITGLGAVHMLEAIRIINPKIRYYQASTSEMFGLVQEVPQTEKTPFYPRSPYGVAKLYAHWMTVNYRESYGLFAASGILFNHESPLRGKEFVTRKITDGVAQIIHGKLGCLELGNLDAAESGTFVLATNRTETVRQFVTMSFAAAGIELEWQGSGVDEKGREIKTGRVLVGINPKFYRPAEVELLIGDASLAEAKLGWKASTPLETLCRNMVQADLKRIEHGFSW